MPSGCFDAASLSVPSASRSGESVELTVKLHPMHARAIQQLMARREFRFDSADDVLRFCVAWGIHTLYGRVPHDSELMEAKICLRAKQAGSVEGESE